MAKQSFAQHLKAAESLARLTGLTQRHISAIETAERDPAWDRQTDRGVWR